jgi:hypothetical protein
MVVHVCHTTTEMYINATVLIQCECMRLNYFYVLITSQHEKRVQAHTGLNHCYTVSSQFLTITG